jgi:hypothetical protein
MRLSSFASTAAIVAAVAGLAAFSGVASAASQVGATSANAALDFRITVPSVVFLQVGTGAFRQDVGTVNEIAFAPTPAQFTALQPVTGTGGDQGGGAVTVRVFGNIGQLQLTSAASTLTNGTDTIDWSQITVVSDSGDIPHGAFGANGAITAVPLALNGSGNSNSRVTNLSDQWTYSYANSAEVNTGVYTGRVTYTVAAP